MLGVQEALRAHVIEGDAHACDEQAISMVQCNRPIPDGQSVTGVIEEQDLVEVAQRARHPGHGEPCDTTPQPAQANVQYSICTHSVFS